MGRPQGYDTGPSGAARFCGRHDGERSVILEGVENEHVCYSLDSTVHGAGCALGRREATSAVYHNTGVVKCAGKVRRR